MTCKIHTQEISIWNEINRTQELWTFIVDLTLQCPDSVCKISILPLTFSESYQVQSTVLAI
jgi:hypothetical protein